MADQQPKQASDFHPVECLNFGYRYSIVAGGLLPRFIVRTHHLSRDFLACDLCTLTELETATARKQSDEVELIAYVLKDCGWQEVSELKQFQVLPRDAKAISKWRNRDTYWNAIAE